MTRRYVVTESFTTQAVYVVEASSKAEAERKFLKAGGDEDGGASKGIQLVDRITSGYADVDTYTEHEWKKQ